MKRLLIVLAVLAAPALVGAQGFDLNPQVVAAYAYSKDAPDGVTASRFVLTANLPGVRMGNEGWLSKLYIGGVGIDIRTVPGYEDLPADYIGWSIPLVTYLIGDSSALIQGGYMQDIGQQGEKHLYAGIGFSVQSAGAMRAKRHRKAAEKKAREEQKRAELNARLE